MNYFRTILPLAAALLIAITACTNKPKTFEEEIRHLYQDKRGFVFLKIPPALLTLVPTFTDDPGITSFFTDARQVGLISFGEGFPVSGNPDLIRSLEEILSRHNYEELLKISENERLISMKVRQNDGKITDLVTIVSHDQSPLMAITLSGEIDLQKVMMMATDFDFDLLRELQAIGRW